MPVKKAAKKSSAKKSTSKSSAKKSGKSSKPSSTSLATRTRAINDKALSPKQKTHGPSCIHCHKTYDPAHPDIASFKNNPGFCSVECGYLESKVDKSVRNALVEAPSKPVAGREVVSGKSTPKEPKQLVSEPKYVPSELQGHAIRVAQLPPQVPVQVIDLTTGEVIQNPSELLLTDDTDNYYSHSFIKQYTDCSASALFRKTNAPGRPAFALERGSAVHGAIEVYIKTGSQSKAEKQFEENWKLMVMDKEHLMSASDQDKVKRGYEETLRMLKDFILENSDLIEQRGRVQSEVEFSVPIKMNTPNGSFTRRFYGKIDFIVWNLAHTEYQIFDFKSSAQVPSDDELDREVQFALYQHACTVTYGKPPTRNSFYYLRGEHVCHIDDDPKKEKIRFSKDKHPRPTTAEGVRKCLKFAFDVAPMSDEKLQTMFDTYYMPAVIGWEAGFFQKHLSDTRKCVSMCMYREHCDTVKSLPLPKFVRVDGG